MASNTAIVFSCAHAHPKYSNERADWLGNLIYDVRPDYVVDLGDTADLASLSSHDTRYPKAMVWNNYERDIESYLDFQERLRHKFKVNKRKRPTFYGFEGNHEHRIKRAIEADPRLEGESRGLSFKHLEANRYYDEYTEYENSGPGIKGIDGVSYAHYFSSGNYGTALSGEHHAYNLIKKRHSSATCGHSHKRNIYFKDDACPHPSIGLVAGCFKGGDETWAGQSNNEWAYGVWIKRNIKDGYYSPQWVSMEELKSEYGK